MEEELIYFVSLLKWNVAALVNFVGFVCSGGKGPIKVRMGVLRQGQMHKMDKLFIWI